MNLAQRAFLVVADNEGIKAVCTVDPLPDYAFAQCSKAALSCLDISLVSAMDLYFRTLGG